MAIYRCRCYEKVYYIGAKSVDYGAGLLKEYREYSVMKYVTMCRKKGG